MTTFYVNNHAQTNGDHEVHRPTCTYYPLIVSKTRLGEFATSFAAVAHARVYYYRQSNGCAFCCPESHTS